MDRETTTGTDDAALAQAWAGGDERGFTALVARYAPLVYSRCRRALGAADADDATQAVFLVLARKRAQAAASPALAAWLLTVADFVIRNARRERKRQRIVATPDLLPALPAPEPAMDDIREHLDACLAELPAAEREAVRLHHLAGHTLAEVAAHTGVPLSTVHDRVRRGLERLRPLLARRGVQVASVAILLACLQAEASAAVVPGGLVAAWRDPAPAGGGAGATAAISARALRWSRPRLSTMSRIAIAGALLLIAGLGTLTFVRAAEPSPPPVPAPPRAAPAAPPDALEGDLDPERARGWLTVSWNDGARTAERLRRVPELALLADAAPTVLARIAALRRAVLLIDSDAFAPREQMVIAYRLQRDLLRLSPQQQIERLDQGMQEQLAVARKQPAVPALPAAGVRGWLESDPEGLAAIAAFLDGGAGGLVACTRSADGWRIGADGLALRPAADRVRVGEGAEADPRLAGLARAVPADADLEIASWFDCGIPGRAVRPAGLARMTIAESGIRLASTAPWANAAQRRAALDWPRLDRHRLDAVPARAFLACALPMSPGNSASSVALQAVFRGMRRMIAAAAAAGGSGAGAEAERMVQAITAATQAIDGNLVAWVEPGVPLPTVTIEADMPRAAADALLAATGAPRAADGSISQLAGMVTVTLGWQDGRLVFTTVPGGFAAIDRSGGFTRQADVQRAFAAMPARQPVLCTVLRPAALLDSIAPYTAMAGPQWAQRLAAYEQRLSGDTAYAFLVIDGDEQGMRIDAAGLLSLVAGGILAAQAQSPLRIAN